MASEGKILVSMEGLKVIAWTMTATNILLTAGRFRIHWRKHRRFDWDDYFNAIALLLLIVFNGIFTVAIPIEYNAALYAWGLSDREPTEQEEILNMRLNTANMFLFFLIIYAVKASFLALYWQIFNISSGFRVAWKLVTVYTALSFLMSFLAVFWTCGSPRDFLDTNACSDKSRSLSVGLITVWCALNTFGDLLLMILPCAMLKDMSLRISQKISLALVFSIVLIVIAFDILRSIVALKTGPQFRDPGGMVLTLEPTTAVTLCALPCYRSILTWNWSSRGASLLGSISYPFSYIRGSLGTRTRTHTLEESNRSLEINPKTEESG